VVVWQTKGPVVGVEAGGVVAIAGVLVEVFAVVAGVVASVVGVLAGVFGVEDGVAGVGVFESAAGVSVGVSVGVSTVVGSGVGVGLCFTAVVFCVLPPLTLLTTDEASCCALPPNWPNCRISKSLPSED
jgi:hypothetical protein